MGVDGLLSTRIPIFSPYKYHGYTVRGTPNCPLILNISTSSFHIKAFDLLNKESQFGKPHETGFCSVATGRVDT